VILYLKILENQYYINFIISSQAYLLSLCPKMIKTSPKTPTFLAYSLPPLILPPTGLTQPRFEAYTPTLLGLENDFSTAGSRWKLRAEARERRVTGTNL